MSLPGHGESVGSAYIRIFADASGLRSDIERQWEENKPDFENMGEEDWDEYNDGRAKSNQKFYSRYLRDEVKTNRKAESNRNLIFRNSMAQRIAELRKAAAKERRILEDAAATERRIRDGQDQDALDRMFRSLANQARQLRLQQRQAERFAGQMDALARRRFDSLAKLSEHFAREDRDRFRRTYSDLVVAVRRGVGGAEHEMDALRRSTDRLIHDADHGFLLFDRRLKDGVRDTTNLERSMARITNRVKDVKIGRFFGEGSRNNFFNIVGKITGKLGEFVTLAGVRAVAATTRFGASLRQAHKDGNLFSFSMRTIENIMAKLIGRVFALGTALGALQLIGGPIAALLSGLAGIITALASTIVVGLIGAIGAALPIMGVFAASMGVIGLAFAQGGKTYAEWKKNLDKALKPVTSQFHELQDAAREGLFSGINKSAPLLAKTLDRITPLIRKVGTALGDAFTGFLSNLQGPQFKKNLDSMEKFFPRAIEKLGKVATNVFGGIAGLMRALVPIANKLLDSWVKGSREFRRFTNSTHGQNVLKKWFDNAYDSGRILWRFVKDLGKVLIDLFTLGEGSGDDIFTSMNKSLERFDRWIRSPAGGASIHKWFDDSREMLTHLGNFVAGVAHLFGRLSSGGKGELNSILDFLGKVADLVAAALPTVQEFLHIFGEVIGGLLDGLTGIFNFINSHKDIFEPIIVALGTMWAAWRGYTIIMAVATAFRTFAAGGAVTSVVAGLSNIIFALRTGTTAALTAREKLGGALAGIGIGVAGNLAGNAVGGAGGTAISIGSGIAGGALAGGVIGGVPGAVIGGAIGGVASAIQSFWHNSTEAAKRAADEQNAIMDSLIAAYQQEVVHFQALTDQMLAAMEAGQHRAEVIRNLSADGSLSTADKAGIKPGALIRAASGKASPLQLTKLNSKLFSAAQDGKITGDEFKDIGEDLQNLSQASLKAAQRLILQDRANGKLLISSKELGTGLSKLKAVFKGHGRSLEQNTVAGLRNREMVREESEAVANLAKKQLAHGRNVQAVAKDYFNNTKGLLSNLKQMGFNSKAVQHLIGDYDKMPKKIATILTGDDTDAKRKLVELLVRIHALPKSSLIKLQAKDEATPVIHGVTDALATIHGKNATISVTKDPSFDAIILSAQNSINGLKGVTNVIVGRRSATGPSVTAMGGVFNGWQTRIIGEAGPEAVVPLRRPLSQVDPSVRALSAIAQGLSPKDVHMASGGIVGGGPQKIVNVEAGAIQVITPTTDPAAVAVEMLDRLSAGGYT